MEKINTGYNRRYLFNLFTPLKVTYSSFNNLVKTRISLELPKRWKFTVQSKNTQTTQIG